MTMLRAGFSDLMAPGLFDVIALNYNQYPDEYTQIFKVKDSKKKYETGTTIEGIGAAPEKNEGAAVSYSDLTQGYDMTFTHKTFATGARITREAYDDDLYSVFKDKLGRFIGRAMKQRWEILGANVLNNGFSAYTGSGRTGGDTLALFSTAHTWASGGTYSNRAATDADLSHTSVETMLTLIENFQEANSINIALVPKKLIVSSGDRWAASVILESQWKSGTANNDKNVLLDMNLSYMVNHYLTDTDAWFVQCDTHSMLFWNRMAPKMEADDDFDTGDAKIKISGRASAGFEEPVGMFGTSGG